jgi:hypothetical protein
MRGYCSCGRGRPPPPRTKWTRRVPHPVLTGQVSSQLTLALFSVWGGGQAYSNAKDCRERLLYSISSGAGFELS